MRALFPSLFITANVHALLSQWEHVTNWRADAIFLQETKVPLGRRKRLQQDMADIIGPDGSKAGWDVTFGANTGVMNGSATAQRGGVLNAVRGPAVNNTPPRDGEATKLYDTGRWNETARPVNSGQDVLYFANVYGVTNASREPPLYQQNEQLLAAAVLRMLSFGPVPYFLLGDFNIDPAQSKVLRDACTAGLIVDIPLEFAADRENPQTTYCRDGCSSPCSGKGTTRIDCVFGTPAAAAAVSELSYRWDLDGFDHVPIQVTLNAAAFAAETVVPIVPAPILVSDVSKLSTETIDDAVNAASIKHGPELERALAADDLDAAHYAWCDMATHCLVLMSGLPHPRTPPAPPRAADPQPSVSGASPWRTMAACMARVSTRPPATTSWPANAAP